MDDFVDIKGFEGIYSINRQYSHRDIFHNPNLIMKSDINPKIIGITTT